MPRNKYPEQTVEKILDAAALLFLQKGYQNTTLQDKVPRFINLTPHDGKNYKMF